MADNYNDIMRNVRRCADGACKHCDLSKEPNCRTTLCALAWDAMYNMKSENDKLQEKCKPTPVSGYVIENGKVVFRSDILGTYREEYDSLEDVVKTLNLYLHECYSFMEVNTHLRGTIARIQEALDKALENISDTTQEGKE